MAKALYIICCESAVVDKATNLLSLINIVEEATFTFKKKQAGEPVGPPGWLKFKIVSGWEREVASVVRPYDWEFAVRVPGIDHEQVLEKGTFEFSASRQRLTADLAGPPIPHEGIMQITSRIKPQGDEVWISQSYSIAIKVRKTGETEIPNAATNEDVKSES